MRPRFRPYFFIAIFLCLGFFSGHVLADNKTKSKDISKTVAQKKVAKTDDKKTDKTARDSRKEKSKDNQLAKNADKKAEGKKGKEKASDKIAATKREEKSRPKEKEKLTKRENEKKLDNKLAKSADKSKTDEHKKKSDKLKDEAKKKEEVAAKKPASAKEKIVKVAEKMEAKRDAKSETKEKIDKAVKPSKVESTLLAKTVAKAVAKPVFQSENISAVKNDEPVRQLPVTKFTFRPVTKITPKVELKFTLAKALAPSYDPPPPVEPSGPDIIEVIEHDSPENRKLDDIYRQEVKGLSLSTIPNVSNRKMDIKKMDADRISQIQEALQKRGYYNGSITGVYDDSTVESMRQFQSAHKIDVTGYATAHTLKLLGLTDWEQNYE